MIQNAHENRRTRHETNLNHAKSQNIDRRLDAAVRADASSRQSLVFTDPVAFRYLRDDPCTKIIQHQIVLEGFELYLVEQWACSREHPTFIINTFTGQSQHKVVAGVLSVPTDQQEWSPRLRLYLRTVSTFHARRKDTPQGTIMVTNLSSFPSALTVIPIPNGNLKDYREIFIVNENLKRLGCSGRSGLTLSKSSGATNAMFIQLYHTHESVPVPNAVVELVKLCQVALVMFDKLAPEFADGLLCDVTERAINDWWAKIGTEFYPTEPTDGILGPTTVAAILGLYLGARNRLNAFGAPTAKDAFDIRGMKRAISYFQRANRLSSARPRRLDPVTLNRLHRSTSKAAQNDRWGVPRAVKSTVTESFGKGGEMMISMVGRDKTGIAEVETLDMQKFSEKASGEYCRWLWHGKSKKGLPLELFDTLLPDDEGIFSGDEASTSLGPLKKRDELGEAKVVASSTADMIYMNPTIGSQSSLDGSDKEQALRRTVLKNVTGRMNDARSSLSRFKGAVSIGTHRGHQQKPSRDINVESRAETTDHGLAKNGDLTSPPTEQSDLKAMQETGLMNHSLNNKSWKGDGSNWKADTKGRSNISTNANIKVQRAEDLQLDATSLVASQKITEDRMKHRSGTTGYVPFISETELHTGLRSSRSVDHLQNREGGQAAIYGTLDLPRQMSTSAVDSNSACLTPTAYTAKTVDSSPGPLQSMSQERASAITSDRALSELHKMSMKVNPVIEARLQDLEELDTRIRDEYDLLSQWYAERARSYQGLQDGTTEILSEEEALLAETFKELGILGAKLEYEMATLVSKVEDVEDGVLDFERQVEDLEAKINTLAKVEAKNDRSGFRIFGWQVS